MCRCQQPQFMVALSSVQFIQHQFLNVFTRKLMHPQPQPPHVFHLQKRPTHQAVKLDRYISSPQPPSLTAAAHLLAPHPAPQGLQATAAAAGRAPRRAGTKRSSEDALRQRAGADPSRVATREVMPARPAPATRQALCAGFQRCAESAMAECAATADEEDAPCECTYDDE